MKAQTLQNKINALLDKIEMLVNVNMIDDYNDNCYSQKIHVKNNLGEMFASIKFIQKTDMESGK